MPPNKITKQPMEICVPYTANESFLDSPEVEHRMAHMDQDYVPELHLIVI
jgi:hypothetical protein